MPELICKVCNLAVKVKKSYNRQVRPYAVRKPKDYVVKAPGDLVQVDSADVRWTGITHAYKHFSAPDIVSRWDVLGVYGRATAGTARDFLDTVIERMPGPVKAHPRSASVHPSAVAVLSQPVQKASSIRLAGSYTGGHWRPPSRCFCRNFCELRSTLA